MISLYNNRKKTLFLFFTSLIIIFVTVWITYQQLCYDKFYYYSSNKIFYKYIPLTFYSFFSRMNIEIFFLIIGILFFFIGALFCLKELLNKKPIIIIDSDGFHTRDYGFISWQDIQSFTIVETMQPKKYYHQAGLKREKFFGIILKDPEKFFSKFSPIKRKFMKLNAHFGAHIYFNNLILSDFDLIEINKFKNYLLENNKIIELQ